MPFNEWPMLREKTASLWSLFPPHETRPIRSGSGKTSGPKERGRRCREGPGHTQIQQHARNFQTPLGHRPGHQQPEHILVAQRNRGKNAGSG